MANDLLSLAGWYFLPQLVTGWLQTAYYAIWLRAGEPKPTPGTRQFARDRQRIQIAVVLAYLFYTIYEADYQIRQAGDFYNDLGVPYDATERTIQSRFRRLTVQYHPDKAPSDTDRTAVESFYVHLKLARDTLVDPTKRFAYDRFGPTILAWRHCTSIPSYLLTGLRIAGTHYAGTSLVLIFLGVVGYLRQAPYWRYLALAIMFAFEMNCLMAPSPPVLLSNAINPAVAFYGRRGYLQFQLLALARKVMLSFFIAIQQIGPLLFPPQPGSDGKEGVSGQQLERLDALAAASDGDVSRLMALEVTPFAGDEASMRELRGSMRGWLVDNTVRSNPVVRDAMGRVLRRRREGAPAGARAG